MTVIRKFLSCLLNELGINGNFTSFKANGDVLKWVKDYPGLDTSESDNMRLKRVLIY